MAGEVDPLLPRALGAVAGFDICLNLFRHLQGNCDHRSPAFNHVSDDMICCGNPHFYSCVKALLIFSSGLLCNLKGL